MGRFGDRKDGKRVRDINGINHIMYHLGKSRCSNEVYIDYPIDVTNLVKYVDNVNKKGDIHLTYFHVFCTGIGKVFYNRPLLNRFLVNGYFYDRNDVLISYVAKTSFDDSAGELMKVLKVKENDNVFSISKKIKGDVKAIRSSKSSGADDLVANVGNLPKFLRSMIAGVFKFLDIHDFLPRSMTRDILYYSSVIVSNLGSIDCKEAIHHHLSDFGTNSVFITMGKIYEKEIYVSGKREKHFFCNFGITLDERIADGFYFVRAIKLLDYIFNNPELLEGNCDDKIDIK